jgi:hypothetical protein
MTAIEMNTSTVSNFRQSLKARGFYSVEFALDEPHPLYQFKIWRSESSAMFVVVKQNSAVLPKLKGRQCSEHDLLQQRRPMPQKADRNAYRAYLQ